MTFGAVTPPQVSLEMTSEKRAQKFHTDDASQSKQTNKQTKKRIEDNNVTTDAHLSISLFFSFINISCSLLNLVSKAKKVVMLCKKNRQYLYGPAFYLLVEIYFCLR